MLWTLCPYKKTSEAGPAEKPAVKRNGWSWRKPAKKAPTPVPAPVNRIPIQPRPQAYAPPAPVPTPLPTKPAISPKATLPGGRPAPGNKTLGNQTLGNKTAVGGRPPFKAPGPAPADLRPPRRRRKWPRRMLVLTLLGAVCCCGIPGYFAWPAAQQFPVSAALPSSVRDLSLRDDNASRKAVDKLTQQLGSSGLSSHQAFAGIYADGSGKRVTVFGTTGWRTNPGQDVQAEVDRLTTDYKITDVSSYDLGQTGAHERCGVGRSNGAAVVVCVWADHGSLATVLLTRRNVTESAALVGVLRSAVLTKG